jgi:segregation and condensation protein B
MFPEHLPQHVEAIVFASEQPLRAEDVALTLSKTFDSEISIERVEEILQVLREKYSNEVYPFEIIESGGGYQFLTKNEYHQSISLFLNRKSNRRLSVAALETLAIIAYKQPVTKPEIEDIRGVNSDYTVQKLMEKELVEIVGRSDEPGKPLLYGTSQFFMDYFGINAMDELPKLKEFEELENQIGTTKE